MRLNGKAPHNRSAKSAPLPDAVKKLGWISFFTDVASEMLYPVVPLFLTTVLGAPVVILGMIEGVSEAIVSVMKGLSGWHSDRSGRRVPYIRWGYGMGAISKPLMALAFSWPTVFLTRALDRTGKGLRTTARDTLIADCVDASQSGRAYGFHRMMDTAGALAGVLLALGLLTVLPGQYRLIFLIAVVPGAAAVWLTFLLKEHKPQDTSAQPTALPPVSMTETLKKLPTAYWSTLFPLMIFSFANSSDALLILRAKNLGLSDTETIMGYMLFTFIYAVSAYPFGTLSDRVGRWPVLLSGWCLYVLVYFGFASLGRQEVWWLFAAYGLYMGLSEGVGRALVRDNTPEQMKGTGMGFYHMASGFLILAGSTAAGLLWDMAGPHAAFLLGGASALAAVVAALFIIRANKLRGTSM